jgi:hypothetical protein
MRTIIFAVILGVVLLVTIVHATTHLVAWSSALPL